MVGRNGDEPLILLTDGETPMPEATLRQLQSQPWAPALRAASDALLLDRYRFAKQHGMSFGDARDMYAVLGYNREISASQYRARYDRGGLAGRIVDSMPDAAFRGFVELIEDEDPEVSTAFETAWDDLDTRLNTCAKLKRTCVLSRQSTYACLLIGAPNELDTELPKGKPEGLKYLMPFSGGGGPGGGNTLRSALNSSFDADCTIEEFDLNLQSERFGQPLWYRLRRSELLSLAQAPRVHWTRMLHVAEGCLTDEVYGRPTLERVWNLLDDLDKVTGGGAEAFWLRANQGLHLNIDPTMSLTEAKSSVPALKEQLELWKHQLTRAIQTRGVDVDVLGSDVANFSNPADAILTQIAGATKIPKRILTGSEMGELASSQDRDNWKDQINGYQTGHLEPYVIRPFVARLVKYGYLPTPAKGPLAYTVRFEQIQTLSEQEKIAGAKSWAETKVNDKPVFTDSEIRDKWYGMPPLTPEQIAEMTPQAEEAQDPASPQNLVEEMTSEEEVEEEDEELVAAGGEGSGVKGHETEEEKKARIHAEQKSQVSAHDALKAKGGSLTKTKGHSEAKIPHKDVKAAKTTVAKTAVALKQKGFTIEKSSLNAAVQRFANKTGGKATITLNKDNSVTVTITAGRASTSQVVSKGKLKTAVDRLMKYVEHEDELVRILETAIEANHTDVIDAILGTHTILEDHKYSSTQIRVPQGIAEVLLSFGLTISEEDLSQDGRETDSHVTVKYGLHTEDEAEVEEVVSGFGEVEVSLGELDYFESDEHDVLFVRVMSDKLDELNELITKELDCTSSYSEYVPHVTIAYLQPGLAAKYAGRTDFVGMNFTADTLVFSSSTEKKTRIALV